MYDVVAGDTFELIARKVYGDDLQANLIAKANPGAAEPLTPGASLIIPDVPGAPQNIAQQVPSENLSEVAVKIAGERFRFWENIRITESIDTIGTVELSAPFDADNAAFREAFRPFTYKSLNVTVGGEPLFTGTLLAPQPTLQPNRKTVEVSAYSLPGVLMDCPPAASAFPVEFLDVDLQNIAKTLADPFGIDVVFANDPGPVFEQVAVRSGEKVFSFLAKLAKQRNLLMPSNSKGQLLFSRPPVSSPPVAAFVQGEAPLVEVTPFFSAQDYYSHITGVEPVLVGLAGSQFTVKNPRLLGVVRPFTFNVDDVDGTGVQTAVEAKAGRMFANAVFYTMSVPTWRDAKGELWKPGSTVTVTAPDAMIYSAYDFTIRGIELNRSKTEETAVLHLIIPGSLSGKLPEVLPWDG